MRIYFGREPDGGWINIDPFFGYCLRSAGWRFEQAVEKIVAWCRPGHVYHTLNPVILNYLTDEQAKEWVWFIDAEGRHIRFGDDESMLVKLRVMGPGEVLADDERIFTREDGP